MNFETLLQDQGLAVALAVALVGCLIWFARRMMLIIERYITHGTKVMDKLTAAVEAQTVAQKEFTEYIRGRDQNGGRR